MKSCPECGVKLMSKVCIDSAVFVNTGEGEYEQLTVWMSEKEALEYKNKKNYFPALDPKIVFKRID